MKQIRPIDRILAVVLAVVMVVSLLPMSVFASTTTYPDAFTVTVKKSSNNEPIAEANISFEIVVDGSTEKTGSATVENGEAVIADVADYADAIADEKTVGLNYSVSAEGFVTKTGTVIISDITANVDIALDEVVPSEFTVSVVKNGSGTVKLDGVETNTVTVAAGSSVTITATPAEGAYIKTVTIAGVNQGITDPSSFEKTIKVDADTPVSVSFVNFYKVTVSKNDGGEVLLDGEAVTEKTVDESSNVNLSVTPEEGYQIATVSINGINETVLDVTNFSKTITVTENTAISVTFVKVYTIVITYDEDLGSVESVPECDGGSVTVEAGETVTITATPKENYRIAKISITGKPDALYSDNTFTHENPYITTLTADKDYTVEITFAPIVFFVTTNTPANGTVSVDKATVDYGDSVTVTISPEEGYTINSVTVNGIDYSGSLVDNPPSAKLTIENITEDKAIEVSFKLSEPVPMEVVTWNSDDALRILDDGKMFIFAKNQNVVFSTTKSGIRLTFADNSTDESGRTKQVTISESKTISKIEVFDRGWCEVKVDNDSVHLVIIIDKVRPSLSLKPESEGVDIYNGDVPVAVKVEEQEQYYSGLASVEYWITVDETASEPVTLFDYSDGEEITRLYEGNIIVPAVDSDSITVTLKAIDRAGNEESTDINLKICQTRPTVSVSIDGELAEGAETGYYNTERTATVTITDLAFCFDETLANDGITITALDGSEIAVPISKPAMITWTHDGNIHTGKIEFTADANYEWEISYTNKADLSNDGIIAEEGESIYKFAVDTTAPTGKITVETDEWDDLLTALTFGIWKNHSISVTAEGYDATSPLYNILYYKSNSDVVLSESELTQLYQDNEFVSEPYTVSDDEQFAVYARIMDYAGNVKYIGTNGVIVDMTESQITLTPDAPNANGFYNGNVTVEVYVNDEAENGVYSGIKTIDYKVIANEGTENEETTQEGNLYTFEVNDATDGHEHPTKDELCKELTKTVEVEADKNNYDRVKVLVTVMDNAGNEQSKYVVLAINTTNPTATISFDNNQVNKLENGHGYFGQDRKATITIVDRASTFNAEAATAGITITAVDGKGERVEIDPSQMISEWSHNGNTHMATVSFTEDAKYTWNLEYTNGADGSIENIDTGDSVTPFSFTVDKTDPSGTITVAGSTWDTLLTILTFGLYKNEKVSVSETHEDETSPVTVEYYKTSDPYVLTAPALDEKYDAGEFAVFEGSDLQQNGISPNEQFVIYLRITDYAGNYIYINSDGYVVDDASCNIQLTPDSPNTNGLYNKDVNVKIQITDAVPYSGIKSVDYWVEKDNQKTQEDNLYTFAVESPAQEDLLEKWTGNITVIAEKNNSCNVVVYVKAVDNAGNVSQEKVSLDIDVTAPEIEIRYNSDKSNPGAKEGYYTSRTATVTITERTHHFDGDAATKGIAITAKDINGNEISGAYSISDWTTVEGATPDAAKHTATIRFAADANYQFAIAYTDKADNANMTPDVTGQKTPYAFTVDTTAPTGTVTAKSAEGREETWSDIVNPLTFGFWSKSMIAVTETHEDLTSPIASVQYYMPTALEASDATTALSEKDLDKVTWNDFPVPELSVSDNAQFTVYVKITDNAGNYTYLSTNGLIVDDRHPVEESIAPEITVTPEQPINGIYKGDVKISITVNDPLVGGTYSGLKEISYKVFDRTSSTPDTATQEGVLFTFTNTNPLQTELQKTWTGEITVDSSRNNSNDIQVVIYAADNAGNAVDNSQKESQSYTSIKIDTTDPVITITPEQLTGYQNKQQTFTITVQERNFDESLKPNDVVNVSVKDIGVYPTFSNWEVRTGGGNGDTTTHTATVSFAQDGVYSFTANVTDLAGRKAAQKGVGEFTIDLTAPTITVSYDNNTAENGKYFNAPRTATITIVEHNFEASGITVTLTATDHGAAVGVPTINGWTGNGDTHTATILYDADALYGFDIVCIDKAGNSAADYAGDSFYIDQTAPHVEISGIVDESANNDKGNIGFVLSATDTNFNAFTPIITAVLVEDGKIVTKVLEVGEIETIEDGKRLVVTNLPDDGIYRINCTVVDKAGNAMEEITLFDKDEKEYVVSRSGADNLITFSVNRDGSTYEVGEYTSALSEKYYVQRVTDDVAIIEINADNLTSYSITLNGKELQEGTDFEVSLEGGNGDWFKYTYRINASLFDTEGEYNLVVSSVDKAENDAFSDVKGASIHFVVDRTAPLVAISGLASNARYQTEKQTVTLIPTDDGGALKSILVLLVDDEGNAIRTLVDLQGEDFENALAENDCKITFELEEGLYQNVRIICDDYADYGSEENVIYDETFTNVSVSSSAFMIFWANKPLRWSVIGGTGGIGIGAALLALLKKRKKVAVG